MALTLPLPPQKGMSAEVYSYLFQMAQLLNVALDQVETVAVSVSLPSEAATKTDLTGQYNNLKSLIQKTADTVYTEMDQISATLEGEYVAVSDFGTYVQQLNTYLEANPEAITQYYQFAADLQANTDKVSAAFESYKSETEGYIRTGIVDWDGDIPIYGVAVGQNLTVSDIDGQTVIDKTHFRAVFTSTKLSFWQDETEVAYVSNNRLYIRDITVLSTITVGNYQIHSTSGLAFQWIGG